MTLITFKKIRTKGDEVQKLSDKKSVEISDNVVEDIKVRLCFVTNLARGKQIQVSPLYSYFEIKTDYKISKVFFHFLPENPPGREFRVRPLLLPKEVRSHRLLPDWRRLDPLRGRQHQRERLRGNKNLCNTNIYIVCRVHQVIGANTNLEN